MTLKEDKIGERVYYSGKKTEKIKGKFHYRKKNGESKGGGGYHFGKKKKGFILEVLWLLQWPRPEILDGVIAGCGICTTE